MCVAVAAVAIAAPQRIRSTFSSVRETTLPEAKAPVGQDALPPSMSDSVQVMVEMDAPPAAVIYGEAYQAALKEQAPILRQSTQVPMSAAQRGETPKVEIDAVAASRVANQITTLDSAQQQLLPALANAGATVIYRTQRAYNGIAVSVSPDRISELASMPGVKAVHPMTPKYPTAFSDIDFLGTRTATGFWNKTYASGVGLHGEGVKVGIIDTGLDYTHTNFGGPGTPNYAGITDKTPVPNAYYPTAKVPFGYDFAGDQYSASGEAGTSSTPQPDNNPLDSNGHGTSTGSLVGGYGVNAGGTTYRGNYDSATPIASMKISPGFAPQAQIIPLRVFGTVGSTNLTTQAVDFAMDPNHDGNLSDHLDILSLSLGSNNGDPNDDTAVACSNAVLAGVAVVTSAGNASDTYYITGSPGAGVGVLSTAASYNDQGGYISDATLVVKAPANLAGSRSYAVYGSGPQMPKAANGSEGDIVEARPVIASSVPSGQPIDPKPLDNAAFMQGKVCLVDRGVSSFHQKAITCQNSGAVAVIIVNQTQPGADPIVAGLTQAGAPPVTIPVVMISKADGDALRGSAAFDPTTGVPRNGARVQVFNDQTVINHASVAADTMPSYSSRGPTLETNELKPDVTAPAEVVGVAVTGTGSGVGLFNGTSSACPHVSGGMALLKQLHPDYSVEELKALMMNTATHDLFLENSSGAPTATRRGISRVGAGRVDFDKASKGNVVIFNRTDKNRVSVSYGNVEVPVDGTVAISKDVTIRNKGTTDVTYNGVITMVNTVGDANFSAPASQVLVRAGQEVTFPLLFRATGSTLKHTKDPSVAAADPNVGISKQYLSEAGGYATLTPTSGSEPSIRIPLYAVVKPVSAMRTAEAGSGITPGTNAATFNLTLTGVPVNTSGATYPVDIISLVKPLELQYINANAENPNYSRDPNRIKYVGVTSDYAVRATGNKQTTVLTFGIEGFGDASVPSFISSDKEIYIDVNFDGKDDFVLYPNSRRFSASNTHTNVYTPTLQNLNNNTAVSLGFFTNLVSGASLDTNSFNNSVILMSVGASSLGYTGAGQSSFQYHVVTFNRNGDFVDETPYMRFDIANPGVDTTPRGANNDITSTGTEPFYYVDLPNVKIPVTYNGANLQRNGSKGVLMMHMHNGRGIRGEVIGVRTPTIANIDPTQGAVGTLVTITGTNFAPGTDVRFSPNVQASQINVLSDKTISCRVPPGAVTGPITVSNSAGSATSSQTFTVVPAPSPSPSPSPIQSPTGRSRAIEQ